MRPGCAPNADGPHPKHLCRESVLAVASHCAGVTAQGDQLACVLGPGWETMRYGQLADRAIALERASGSPGGLPAAWSRRRRTRPALVGLQVVGGFAVCELLARSLWRCNCGCEVLGLSSREGP